MNSNPHPENHGGAADPQNSSVAGEEDPGAALDVLPTENFHAGAMSGSSAEAGGAALQPGGAQDLGPEDVAPPGTPGTGESICRVCGGSGQHDGAACANCSGTGKVIVGVGGG